MVASHGIDEAISGKNVGMSFTACDLLDQNIVTAHFWHPDYAFLVCLKHKPELAVFGFPHNINSSKCMVSRLFIRFENRLLGRESFFNRRVLLGRLVLQIILFFN